MISNTGSTGFRRATIRRLPFFFSGRFFLLFVCTSILLVPIYYAAVGGIGVPVAVDLLILCLALVDFFLTPSPKEIMIERPVPYPLAVDKPNDVWLEVTNRTGVGVQMVVSDDIPLRCVADSLPVQVRAAPGSGTRVSYRITPYERGNGEFGDITYWIKGRLGLVWKSGESHAARTVKLYPGLALIERHALRLRNRSQEERFEAWSRYR